MKTFVSLFLAIGILMPTSQVDAARDPELMDQIRDLDDRYGDFYQRQMDLKRQRFELQQAADEQRRWREKLEKERDEARRQFVRPKPVIQSAKEFEQKKLQQEKEFEKARKQYVKNRDYVEKLKRTAKRIPEDAEVGLDSGGQ
ncbi:MAG: hypothetical protein H6626_05440 [Pseudobdellovibrionaceae bacterium]|nr:hypothetical protein [Bdellovibrionales bacterium]USN48537.1 MAG: hypothetical protein H6626_05440 [Pseudobdellovibrionaceae bacterium]